MTPTLANPALEASIAGQRKELMVSKVIVNQVMFVNQVLIVLVLSDHSLE